MSGDELQRQHNVSGALAAYRTRIKNGTADWHDYHMAGVMLSTLAETTWLVGNSGWTERFRTLIVEALGFLREAEARVPAERTINKAAVDCDLALALARHTRLEDSMMEMQADIDEATRLLQGVVERLTPIDYGPAIHQMAIAYDFLTRLAWGRHLDFYVSGPDMSPAQRYAGHAVSAFALEYWNTPDKERAYRSFLCYLAIGFGESGNTRQRRKYASMAFHSAGRYGDRPHRARALAIWLFGRKGERWLQKRRGAQ